jgi:hypothetical protein
MKWVDPRERTMDEMWEAADKACQWRSPYMAFFGLYANITGRGGWNALVWPGLGIVPSYPEAAAWGHTPRLALGALIATLEAAPDKPREPLWFEHD